MMPRLLAALFAALALRSTGRAPEPELKLGFIGLGTSHSVAFAKIFHDEKSPNHVPGARVVCAFPGGSPDIEASWSRVKGYTAELRDKHGVEIVDSIAEVVRRSDAIMILSVDGRAHLP